MPTEMALSERFERQKRSEELQVSQALRTLKIVGKTLQEATKDMAHPGLRPVHLVGIMELDFPGDNLPGTVQPPDRFTSKRNLLRQLWPLVFPDVPSSSKFVPNYLLVVIHHAP